MLKFQTSKEARKWIWANQTKLKSLYFKKDLTAREVALKMGIEYPPNFTKMLYNILGSKGKQWGGKRAGSGNKPGITFCKTCSKKTGSCGDAACL